MVISAADGLSSVTVKGQFSDDPDRFCVEEARFAAGYRHPIVFRIASAEHDDIGDDRAGRSGLNEFLFGTDGAEQVFGDTGFNLIWPGEGADGLIYEESDPGAEHDTNRNQVSAVIASDTVTDFDPLEDRLDFTGIAGPGFADLAPSADAEGDAVIRWDSGTREIADIRVELRGVAPEEIRPDLFLFA